jgi:uncharacterized membrane protein YjjP (DUF1212 family)
MSDLPANDLLPRVAVLEEIARSTKAALERIERRLDAIEATQRSDFRWLLGIMLGGYGSLLAMLVGLLGVLAHGFHWI